MIWASLHTTQKNALRGMSLIDVVVGVSVMVLIFLSIFGAFRISIELVFSTKAKTGAVSLMTDRLEYIRSLPYASVGTVGGIPAGSIPQLEQTTLNGITYTVRTLIQYTDAPEDGLDINDENGITADYKTVKVEVLWNVKNSTRSTYAVTRVAPAGLETLASGGTLKVSVFNAVVAPVEGASVHIINSSTNPAVDVTASTNAQGIVSFPGAPEAGGYEIIVTKSGYSTAQTYDATLANPNPSPAHVAVVDQQTTSSTFFIDTLGSLLFTTYEPVGPGMFSDTFSNSSQLSATSSIDVVGGSLALSEETPGVYAASGSAQSTSITPALLNAWNQINFTTTLPPNTAALVHLYYYDGTGYVLVPDTDLVGNAAGFASGPINISALPTATYTTLRLGTTFTTGDTTVTPEITDWSVSYTAGPTPLPGVSFDIHGSKTIGTNGASPVYKYDNSFTTDSNAQSFIDNVEWDTYTVNLTSSYDIAERCPNDITVSPGQHVTPYYYLAPNTANSLRVYVSSGGNPLAGATVTISGAGTFTTSSCGQVYAGGISAAMHTISISKSGYVTENDTITVSGDSELLVGLTAQ